MNKLPARIICCSFISIVLLSACTVNNQKPADSIVTGAIGKKLDTLLTPHIQRIIKSYDLPGLAIGVVKDEGIIYAKAFGYLNIETKEPVKLTSLFHMASISKPFVATAIMQLVEENRINLDSTVVSYLPYFQLDDERYREITIRQMLNHISGMTDVQDYEWDKPVYSQEALERYVRSISSEKMRDAPGKSFAYSNMAFECLGDVIAKVSGLPFADYVKENILDPSGMEESTFLKPDYLPENWAAPHIRYTTTLVSDVYPYNRMHGPSSTLHSNVIEMSNWALTNLNRGTFRDNSILASESYDLLWKPWFDAGRGSKVGLSWFLGEIGEYKAVGHSGGDLGFNTDFLMLPELNVSVVVLCNFIPAPVRDITSAAVDIILGGEPQSIVTPAVIPVCKEMEKNGLEAAVSMWDSLSANHADEYDFHHQHFMGLYMAMTEDREEEASALTKLCLRVLPENAINTIRRQAEGFFSANPDNAAVQAMLEIFSGATVKK